MSEQVTYVLPMMVLLPIIPAYILFKVLKSEGSVNTPGGAGGPLLGLKIQLGGAFAGYFALLVVLLYSFRGIVNPDPPPTRMVWNLRGQILDDHQHPLPIGEDSFVLNPRQRLISTDPSGGFYLNFIQDPSEEPPTISVSYGDFLPLYVKLDKSLKAANINLKNHTIDLPAITLARANAEVKQSVAVPVVGVPDEYARFGTEGHVAPPPGYGSGTAGPNQ